MGGETIGLIIALSVIIPLALTGFILYRVLFAGRGHLIQNRAKAKPAAASVVSMAQAGGRLKMGGQMFTRVILRLKMNDPFQGDYQADASWWIDNLYIPQIQPGAQLEVKIGSDGDPVIYPQASWAGVSIPDLRIPR